MQLCPICAPHELRENVVVDLIMHRTMADLDFESESLDELIITLPDCGHVFTVETLDGHCGLTEYYRSDGTGKWLGLEKRPAWTRYTDHGGNEPARLVDEAAGRIARGETKVAVVTGGEALASGEFATQLWFQGPRHAHPCACLGILVRREQDMWRLK